MPYFHVQISDSTAPDKFRCIAQNLAEADLKSSILKPYRAGKPILAAGRIWPQAELRGIKVIRTEGKAEDALNKASADVDKEYQELNSDPTSGIFVMPFLGYGIDQIDEAGIDVTHQYIKSGPGEGGPLKAIGVAINNPWITGIGTAVFASAIAAWLKLS